MNYSIIDSDDYPASGIKAFTFPGGEPQVQLSKPLEDNTLLFLKLRTWTDVGYAACLLSILDQEYYDSFDNIKIFIPYFPAARADKISTTTSYTVGLMLNILSMAGREVYVFDGHSTALTNSPRIMNFDWTDLPSLNRAEEVVGIIVPDNGAIERATAYRDKFYPNVIMVQGTKERDQLTGHITYKHIDKLNDTGHYIILDDLCDGGATFNLLMDALKNDPLYNLCTFELLVSHGIFSKGLVNIDPKITKITTTDSWCKQYRTPDDHKIKGDERLTVVPLKSLFDRIMEE